LIGLDETNTIKIMKKRSRKAAKLYKEPSSDLSDLELDSLDESEASMVKGSRRQKAA